MGEVIGIILISLVFSFPICYILKKLINKCNKLRIEPIVTNFEITNTEINIENSNNRVNEINENENEIIKISIKDFIKNNSNIIKYKESVNGKKECIICLDEFIDNEEIKILQCLHYFHKKCIDCWLDNNSNCPECQVNLLTIKN